MKKTLASRRRRFVATAIDFILVPSFALLLMLVSGVLEHADDYVGLRPFITAFLLGLSSYLLLNLWLLWQRGQTLGKAICGIAIVDSSTAQATPVWKLVLLRAWFFPLLYLLPLGWFALIPLVDLLCCLGPQRRCLHDMLVATDVVKL